MNLFDRFVALFRPGRLDREMTAEIAEHLERETQQNLARGMPSDEARFAALRAFGGVEQIKERERDARGFFWLEQLAQDLRYALRMLRRDSGFTATVVLTLALGIGGCTAVFSLVNHILLRALPYDEPQNLVHLWEDASGKGTGRNIVAGGQFGDWRAQATTLESIAAIRRESMNLTGLGEPERLAITKVSASYLRTLRVRPALGRDFQPDEDQPGKGNVAILSHRLWQQSFASDPQVVGREILLDSESYTVVGVLASDPPLPYEGDVLLPFVFGTQPWHHVRGDHRLRVIGRIKPGVTIDRVRTEFNAITDRLRPLYPSWKKHWGTLVVPLHEQSVEAVRLQLWVLFGAVGFVLLIACANVAGLLLARMSSRRREVALRVALGAGRGRVLRQLLTESVLLSALGGGAGLLVSFWATASLTRLGQNALGPSLELGLDIWTLGFATGVSVATGILFGLAPALHLADAGMSQGLKLDGNVAGGRRQSRLRRGLIVAEVALALTLLVGASLLMTTLWRLHKVPPGFEPHGVLAMDISIDPRKFADTDRRTRFVRQILERLESLAEVEAVAASTSVPMSGFSDTALRAEYQPERDEVYVHTDRSFASPGFFRALRIPLLQGREFTPRDEAKDAPPVVILSASLARKVFPDRDPIGQAVRMQGEHFEVVGVVGDVRQRGLDHPMSEYVYQPDASAWGACTLLVRTAVPPLAAAETCRRVILQVDADQPVANIRTLESVITTRDAPRRLMLILLSVFAGTAVLLVAVGLYGLIAFGVVQRTREIGIRMALGAGRRHVLSGVMREGLVLAIVGVVCGLAAACGLSQLLVGLLFRVTPTDPFVLGGVALLLLLIAAFACWLPARRAATINPIEALRCE
ncbi:ABC transporter permease [Opitutus terrae]|uniref:Permease n=1 Tax=Opitutus terrae (strain DSM 11246 / JCM 15787 / PB90-1) TaxID=452637 RepID=B1ZX24_OPITP|nr:ABC transporter permease [Opitutus terrae]ACB75135.1 permease [Opitutus terrae PB90-1]